MCLAAVLRLLRMLLWQKHKVTKKKVSGARTKKSVRKQAHKERVAAEVEQLMGDEQMADVAKSSLKRKTARKKGPAKAAVAGAEESMQE